MNCLRYENVIVAVRYLMSLTFVTPSDFEKREYTKEELEMN